MEKRAHSQARPFGYPGDELKPDHRPESNPQVVMRPVVEVNLIPDVKPQPDRPKMSFEPPARVQHGIHVATSSWLARIADFAAGGAGGVPIEPKRG
jgi:hypothetical protein